MAYLRSLYHLLLIDFDSQARPIRYSYEAIGEPEDLRILEVIKEISTFVVMDAKTLLLDERVRRACIKLHTGCQCDRAKRAMRRNGHII